MPIDFPVPVTGFAAYSGTGKTTLLLKVLPLLKEIGLRVAVVKHAHHSFELDRPGKDSYELRAAGADEMLVAGRCRFGWIRECRERQTEPRLHEALAVLDPSHIDLVLVEGFKHEPYAKIELHRPALGRPLIFPSDPNVIAIASDQPLTGALAGAAAHLPQLPLNDPDAIAGFILDFCGRGKALRASLAG